MAQRTAHASPKDEGEAPVIYILDTDVFTIAELPDSREYGTLHSRVLELTTDDALVTTIVTYEEQTRGWLAYAAKSQRTTHQIKAYARLGKHLRTYSGFRVLDFDESAAREFDRLRGLKLRTGSADLKIAAITISQNAILISRNLADFKKIPDLHVEDWIRS
jgi:tRNA(fMet)-specific endonuclease VapC